MALIFSPVTQEVIEGAFLPRPRHAFIMSHSGDRVAEEDEQLEKDAVRELKRVGFIPVKASDIAGTGDYLEKIIALIRGCGFGVAVFSPYTPAPTLANIFFEVGMCHVFGKPVVILKTDEAKTPSDFVRTEWVSRKTGEEDQFRKDVRKAFGAVKESAEYFKTLGEVAMVAEEVDYELAFERFRQAVLIGHDAVSLERIQAIHELLGAEDGVGSLQVALRRLRAEVAQFLHMVPAPT